MNDREAPTKLAWVGRVITGLLAAFLTFSAVAKFLGISPPNPDDPQFAALGIPPALLVPLGVLELACVVVYVVPATSVTGAVLLTGYMGGAIFTHLRVGQSVVPQTVLAILVWVGLYLCEPRLWQLLPLRRRAV
jgi:hypothetical protein